MFKDPPKTFSLNIGIYPGESCIGGIKGGSTWICGKCGPDLYKSEHQQLTRGKQYNFKIQFPKEKASLFCKKRKY